MAATKGFVFTEEYFKYDYGPHHPLRIERLKLTHGLIQACGLLDLPNLVIEETIPAAYEEIKAYHRIDYLDVLRRASRGECSLEEAAAYGLGPGDNPVFKGIWEWSLLTTGASLQCARMVADGRADIAFNMAGGLHHAMTSRATGFCYVNDIVIAIMELLKRGLRVAYVDVDAHHGDGVQAAFEDTDHVLTISLHQHGRTLFPGTGYVYETGKGRGQGFTVNLPLFPGTDDELYGLMFHGIVPELIEAFNPDVLVTQLGVDTFRTDPLTDLCLTNNGFTDVLRAFKHMRLPWVALGGGGYHVVNVARAWTLAWAIMNDVETVDELPDSFIRIIQPHGYREKKLRDERFCQDSDRRKENRTVVRQVLETVRQTILPVVARAGRRHR
jgi:acetoin utilization protein AcuC